MKRYFLRSFFLAALCLFSLGADYLGEKKFDASRNIGGTFFQITIFDAPAADAALAAERAFTAIEETMARLSSRNPTSAISRLNQPQTNTAVSLDEDTYFFLKKTAEIYASADNAQTILSGAVLGTWRDAKEKDRLPAAGDLQSLIADSFEMEWDDALKSVRLTKAGRVVEADEVAKAYAVDKALSVLKKNGVTSGLVSTDSVTRSAGLSQEGRDWRFGIEHPRKVEGYALTLSLDTEKAVATAGDYQEFFLFHDKRYPFIFDPKTASPPDNGVVSVTVLADDAFRAATFARAFFILGAERSYELVERMKDNHVHAVFIEQSKSGPLVLSCSEGAQPFLREIDL